MITESRDHTGQHVLTFEKSARKHCYTLDGKTVIGVSSIKKAYPPSDGLIQYMIKQGIEEYKTGAKLKRAASVGTVMHDYAHCKRLKLPFDQAQVALHPDKDLLLGRFALVDQWLEQQTDEIVLAEKSVASVTFQYCGTFDVLVRRGAQLVLQDYKSTKGFFEDQFIQLGLYAQAVQEWLNLEVGALEVIRFADDAEKPESFLTTDVDDFREQGLRLRATVEFQHKWKTFFDAKYKESLGWKKKAQ